MMDVLMVIAQNLKQIMKDQLKIPVKNQNIENASFKKLDNGKHNFKHIVINILISY